MTPKSRCLPPRGDRSAGSGADLSAPTREAVRALPARPSRCRGSDRPTAWQQESFHSSLDQPGATMGIGVVKET
jgi:hypothetical protein